MRFLRIAGLALAAGSGLGIAAAHAAQVPTPPATVGVSPSSAEPADDPAASLLMEHHRHQHSGGVTRFVAMSLDTLGTDDAKRPRIEKLQSDLQAEMAPARQAGKDLLLTLADGVAAGAMDRPKLDAILATLATAAEAEHQASLDTLNQLHAILSPSERLALVDKVQAHWEVWREVNHQEPPGARERGGRLAELTAQLGLTPDQVEKIGAAYHTALAGLHAAFDPSNAEAHVQAFSTAFAARSFDAKSVRSNPGAHLAGYGATRMALFYEAVTPQLTPDQRTKLAEHLREHGSYASAAPRT
jgi:hypothetical protein